MVGLWILETVTAVASAPLYAHVYVLPFILAAHASIVAKSCAWQPGRANALNILNNMGAHIASKSAVTSFAASQNLARWQKLGTMLTCYFSLRKPQYFTTPHGTGFYVARRDQQVGHTSKTTIFFPFLFRRRRNPKWEWTTTHGLHTKGWRFNPWHLQLIETSNRR